MKKITLLFPVLLCLSSCSQDVEVPCDKFGGIQDNLCREYRYVNGKSIGFLEFEYKGDSALVASFYNTNAALLQTTTTRLKDGRTNVIVTDYPDRKSLVESWHYNEMDSLNRIVFGANDSVVEMTYEDGNRILEAHFTDSILKRYTVYHFYLNENVLFRVSDFNGQDSLLRYKTIENFSNGIRRVDYFDGNDLSSGHWRFRLSPTGLVISGEFRDENGDVAKTETYSYNSSSNPVEHIETKADQTSKSVFLYY